MSYYNTLTFTTGPQNRLIHLKLHEVDQEDQEMEISIERISCNSFYINAGEAMEIIKHLKRQFEL